MLIGPTELTLAGLRRLGAGSVCDEEPIHLSGAIQPHGFLLGVDPTSLLVRVASENVAAFTGTPVEDAVGHDLAAVIGPTAATLVSNLVTVQHSVRLDPVRVGLDRHGAPGSAPFDVMSDHSGPLTLLEFESGTGSGSGPAASHQLLRTALDPDLSRIDARQLCTATARTIQQLTGFDRVLVYKFDDDAHGVVVAETTAQGRSVRSLLGLHYPAGDIPRQARALLLTKRVRAIPDVTYQPVALRGQAGRVDVAALNLTGSDLRSVSPSHLQYLRQQGIAGTLSLSLVCGEKLWGMVLCHHDTPRYVSAQVRSLCETLTHILSLQLQVRGNFAGRERAAARTSAVAEAASILGESRTENISDKQLADSLLAVIPADSIVLHLDGQTFFQRPIATASNAAVAADSAAVARIVEISNRLSGTGDPLVWSTDRLLEAAVPAPVGDLQRTDASVSGAGADTLGGARGLLTVTLNPGTEDKIVWVRHETILDVEWAGPTIPRPATPAPIGDDRRYDRSGSVRQQIRDRSAPWSPEDLEAATALAQALPQAMLRRAGRRFAEHDAGSRAALAAATARRQELERDLQRKLRLEALGEMAGGVAHDFNNLLGVILTQAELVDATLRTAGQLEETELRQLIDDNTEVLATAQRAARLTKQLLGFARREVSQPRIVSVNEVLTDLADLLVRSIGAHIRLDLVLTDSGTTVFIDPDQFERVVINLAVNARDAMPTGGTVTITTSVREHGSGPGSGASKAGGPWVWVKVSDTGCGIPADIKDRIFDPFFTTKTDGEGTGLGLSTVHSIVEHAGGKVEIRSQPGMGTAIAVGFSLVQQSAEVAPVAFVAALDAPTGRTVLLVDDEPLLRSGIRRWLGSAGYHVLDAENGPAALALADNHPEPIDLLVTDVAMPGMLGREVATRVRSSQPAIKVLFMSGFAVAAPDGTGQLDPGDALIDKPFGRADLLAKLNELAQSTRPSVPSPPPYPAARTMPWT